MAPRASPPERPPSAPRDHRTEERGDPKQQTSHMDRPSTRDDADIAIALANYPEGVPGHDQARPQGLSSGTLPPKSPTPGNRLSAQTGDPDRGRGDHAPPRGSPGSSRTQLTRPQGEHRKGTAFAAHEDGLRTIRVPRIGRRLSQHRGRHGGWAEPQDQPPSSYDGHHTASAIHRRLISFTTYRDPATRATSHGHRAPDSHKRGAEPRHRIHGAEARGFLPEHEQPPRGLHRRATHPPGRLPQSLRRPGLSQPTAGTVHLHLLLLPQGYGGGAAVAARRHLRHHPRTAGPRLDESDDRPEFTFWGITTSKEDADEATRHVAGAGFKKYSSYHEGALTSSVPSPHEPSGHGLPMGIDLRVAAGVDVVLLRPTLILPPPRVACSIREQGSPGDSEPVPWKPWTDRARREQPRRKHSPSRGSHPRERARRGRR